MLCPSCRRQLDARERRCTACGRAVTGAARPGELVVADGRRVPVAGVVSIGRAAGNTLRLPEPGVSRRHAIVRAVDGGVVVEDAGSRAGTFVGGRRVTAATALADGDELRCGPAKLTFERRRAAGEAGRTVIVGRAQAPGAVEPGRARPRLHPEAAIKQLGDGQWIVRHAESGAALRMGEGEAAMLGLLDGTHTMQELVEAAERRNGPGGPMRLAQMLASLAERGLLEHAAPAETVAGRLARLMRPRDRVIPQAGAVMRAIYDRGGFLLFTRPVQVALAVVGVFGLAGFALLLASGAVLPFRVAGSYGLGGLIFLLARLALVTAHELAHGLTLLSFGRPVRRAGLKLVLVFPYAFVDTSEAWLEPRRRRIAISAAGPACDLVTGGAFAIAAALLDGLGAQIAFQLAFAAYVGAFYNLNPLLDRDGYQILVDVLDEPNLRRRSRERLVGALSGAGGVQRRGRLLLGFAAAAWAWSLVGLGIAALAMTRSIESVGAIVPPALAWGAFGLTCAVLAAPALIVVVVPLVRRRAKPRRTP